MSKGGLPKVCQKVALLGGAPFDVAYVYIARIKRRQEYECCRLTLNQYSTSGNVTRAFLCFNGFQSDLFARKLKKCKRPIPFLICQIVFFLPIVVYPQSQPLVGHWEGAYVRLGAVQTISVDFFVDGNTLRGKYDIPDLSIYDEPIRDLDNSSL